MYELFLDKGNLVASVVPSLIMHMELRAMPKQKQIIGVWITLLEFAGSSASTLHYNILI